MRSYLPHCQDLASPADSAHLPASGLRPVRPDRRSARLPDYRSAGLLTVAAPAFLTVAAPAFLTVATPAFLTVAALAAREILARPDLSC